MEGREGGGERKRERVGEMAWKEKQRLHEGQVLLTLKIHSRGQKQTCLEQPMRPLHSQGSLALAGGPRGITGGCPQTRSLLLKKSDVTRASHNTPDRCCSEPSRHWEQTDRFGNKANILQMVSGWTNCGAFILISAKRPPAHRSATRVNLTDIIKESSRLKGLYTLWLHDYDGLDMAKLQGRKQLRDCQELEARKGNCNFGAAGAGGAVIWLFYILIMVVTIWKYRSVNAPFFKGWIFTALQGNKAAQVRSLSWLEHYLDMSRFRVRSLVRAHVRINQWMHE